MSVLGACGADWAGRPLIAIVGMGGVFPGAPDLRAFRRMLRQGRLEIGPVPASRWEAHRYRGRGVDQTPVVRAALLPALPDEPDPRASPAGEASYLMERALLCAAREAATDAGWRMRAPAPAGTAVVLGMSEHGTASQRSAVFALRAPGMLAAVEASRVFQALGPAQRSAILERTRQRYEESLRDEHGREDRRASVYTSVAAGRVASLLDVRGPHMVVDAGGASSLAALDVAIQMLQQGRQDMVVCGGASAQVTPLALVTLARLGVLCEHGPVPFGGRERSGTMPGEGAGVVILCRLEDALRRGLRVRAVIRGLGASMAAEDPARLVPDPDSQARALHQAYARAGYGPEAVQYVEACASGVFEADQAEILALAQVFAPRRASPVVVGAVAERVGALRAGAGMAGLLRTLLAMEEGELPFQVSLNAADRDLALAGGSLVVSTRERPWPAAAADLPRRASVTALGMGGASLHVTLESYEPRHHHALAAGAQQRGRSSPGERAAALRGMGAVLPGSPELAAFWTHALTVRRAHGLAEEHEGVDGRRHLGARVRDPVRQDDALAARAHAARGRAPLDVQERWLLAAAGEAVADAGLSLPLPPRTALFLAAPAHGPTHAGLELRVAHAEFRACLDEALAELHVPAEEAAVLAAEAEAAFKAALPAMSAAALSGSMRDVVAGRLARTLGITDVALAVDAGCSSSLAAVDLAAAALASGACDVAVVAAMWGGPTPEYLVDVLAFQDAHGTSCRPFEAGAAGCFSGEGAVVHILQRACDLGGAPAHAVIRGVAARGNGRQRSVHAVSAPAMVQAILAAADQAGVDPATVGLIEAHGSCTRLGDRMEASALARVYGRRRGQGQRAGPEPAPVYLSCSKPLVGNLMTAAGAVSLASAALALRHGLVPPLPGFVAPAPDIALEPHGLYIARRERPWSAAAPGLPRRAALSSYSIGGLNYHVILEQAPLAGLDRWPAPDGSEG